MLKQKKITVKFEVGEGEYQKDSGPQVVLKGYRCSAEISNVCLGVGSKLALKIYGIPYEIMNKLSTLGIKYQLAKKNRVTVLAGDGGSMEQVFSGTIQQAYADYSAQPDVHLVVDAKSGFVEGLEWNEPTSLPGDVEVSQVIAALADKIGWAFSNHGVKTVLRDVYADGSAINQIRYLARSASIACSLSNDCVTIWPNGSAPGNRLVSISPETGMVGYPAFGSGGIIVRHLFTPDITQIGNKISVNTSVPQANGTYYVHVIHYHLSSETPDGPWMATMFMNSSAIFYPGRYF